MFEKFDQQLWSSLPTEIAILHTICILPTMIWGDGYVYRWMRERPENWIVSALRYFNMEIENANLHVIYPLKCSNIVIFHS